MNIPIEPRPVTPAELQLMFRVLAGVDGHQRSGDDVTAWMLAAQAGQWTCAQLAAATLALARDFTGFRIMPGHVGEQIKAAREQIRTRFYSPDPPRELADDPAGEIAWRRRAIADYTDRALRALATGHALEDVPMTLTAEPDIPVLDDRRRRIEQITREIGSRKAVPDAAPPVTAKAALDPERMADARAELDARRPGDVPAPQEPASDATATA